MKVIILLFLLLITLSTLFFVISKTAKAEEINNTQHTQQTNGEIRVELKWIDGVLWIIVYDADENILQVTSVGHIG